MIKSIPLNKLVQSPRNVRRHGDPAADAELKASISACGLLQNLIVRPAAKGKFEVEAGERRWRAMLGLADEKLLARDYEVTCLVLDDSAEAAVETSSRDLLDALRAFADAAGRVLEHPAREIREVTAAMASVRVRPNSETFRAVMRRPGARTYPSRTAQESADIPENRYLRGLVGHCRRLARSVARSSCHHQAHLTARENREKSRAAELLAVESVEIDPEIFDNQLSDLRARLEAVALWPRSKRTPWQSERLYRFTVGREFKASQGGPKEFFYDTPDRDDRNHRHPGINFSVARLPEDLHELVIATSRLDKGVRLDLTGNADITKFQTANDKVGRRATFTHISAARAHSPLLARREAARSRYEQHGWQRPMSRKEREEYPAQRH